jgi:PadR family transcriptional regulator PadR
MEIENSISQMRKGVLDFCVLSLLSKDDLYASDIIRKLKESKLIVVEGTLYPLLNKLKNGNLLNYRWEESTLGPPRKYYKLTPEGELFLKELENSWSDLVTTVEHIKSSPAKLKLNPKPSDVENTEIKELPINGEV